MPVRTPALSAIQAIEIPIPSEFLRQISLKIKALTFRSIASQEVFELANLSGSLEQVAHDSGGQHPLFLSASSQAPKLTLPLTNRGQKCTTPTTGGPTFLLYIAFTRTWACAAAHGWTFPARSVCTRRWGRRRRRPLPPRLLPRSPARWPVHRCPTPAAAPPGSPPPPR